MNSLLKQRIIGAVVLVSLGIIFVPMLLTGKDDFTSDELKTNIPPMPMYEIKAPHVLLLPSEASSELVADSLAIQSASSSPEPLPSEDLSSDKLPSSDALSSEQASKVAQLDADVTPEKASKERKTDESKPEDSVTATPVPEKTPIVKQPIVKQSIKATPAASDAKTKPALTPTLTSPPAKAQAPVTTVAAVTVKEPIVSGWVVQIGSFSVERNAVKLRDKLRKKGHASFVESFKKNNGMIFRVRVGPELTKDLAENLNKKLNQETKLKGLVMRYPN